MTDDNENDNEEEENEETETEIQRLFPSPVRPYYLSSITIQTFTTSFNNEGPREMILVISSTSPFDEQDNNEVNNKLWISFDDKDISHFTDISHWTFIQIIEYFQSSL